MYHSLSKLMHETQASAAKKLGALENAINDDNTVQDILLEQEEEKSPSQSYGNEGRNKQHPSSERFTLQEFQIW